MMRMNRELAGLSMIVAFLVPGVGMADVQPPQDSAGKEEPWNQNVSPENQDAAEKLLRAGNVLMKKSALAEAEAQYRQALAYWDHPSIHYNLAVVLARLERPVEAHEHFSKALRHGEAPLGAEKYERARRQLESLEKELARVEVICADPQTVVSVDGQMLPLVNGRYEGVMRPRVVKFIATQQGHPPQEKELALAAGVPSRLSFKRYTPEELAGLSARWAPWKPWAAMGAGVGLVAGGGLLHLQARDRYRSFDKRVVDCSAGDVGRGCRAQDLDFKRSQMRTLNKVSMGTMALGGAALATGTVLLFLNRARPQQGTPDGLEQQQGLVVSPLVGRGSNGVLIALQY